MKEITLDTLQKVYARFKAYVYYDNFNLALRTQLAEYENDPLLIEKLNKLANELNDYLNSGNLSKRITKMINDSGFIVLPKSFINSGSSQKKNNILISNQHAEEYNVEKTTILFDGNIELHLISTLWIVEEGIKLNNKIGYDSYGYHLPMHPEENRLGPEKLLFTKYFEKYQEWRDKGIRAAKHQINEGNDVVLISLDIKSFFHSTHIDFNLLNRDLNTNNEPSLTDLIEKICIVHTKKISKKRKNQKPLLPIGLVSSGVIANWLLSDFDKDIKDRMAPVYYGRYVDDIFIVVSNVKPHQEELSKGNDEDKITKKTVEWLEKRFFPDKTPLYATKDFKTLKFSDDKYYGLEIQAAKLKLFYFSPEWPHAMLNKFQKTLEENSSAFWFLPDEEEMKESLDDEAYDMQYEDTINKFRSISDIKASKYGASVFLAKRIKLAILHSGAVDDEITKEIFRFFKGVSILALYNMWEKVFSYLIVTNDIKAIKKLHKEILKALLQLKSKENRKVKLVNTLMNHLDVCLQMAFSLNPALFDWLSKNDESFNLKDEKVKKGINNLRYSLLTRHHYLPLPSLVITDYYINTEESLLSENLIEKLVLPDSKLEKNAKLISENWRIPRWFYLQEICIHFILYELKTWKTNNVLFRRQSSESTNEKTKYSESYIDDCCKLFKEINNRDLSKSIQHKEFKSYRYNNSPIPKLDSSELIIKTNQHELGLKLGLSNMKLNQKDLMAAISKKSIIDKEKRSKHFKHLNLADQEKVDLLILPETSVPLELLYAYSDESRRKQRAFIFGLEHFTIKNFCFNFSIALLPLEVGKMKEVLILPRLKNHYSPKEEVEIRRIGKEVPNLPTNFYHLIKWKGIQFTIYNCYELTDVVHRSIFCSELDVLFAIEYNKDTNYFSNIAEASCRDLHCYFVQANTSEFGDSRVVEPRETQKMNPVRVKGGENNVILRYKLDIEGLRAFQIQRLPFQLDNHLFKTTPPDFDHDNVEGRGK